MNIRTFKDISKYSDKLQKLIEFSVDYKNGDLNSFKNSYNLYVTGTSKPELLKSYNKDINVLAIDLTKIQILLQNIENGKMIEFDKEHNSLQEVFGSFYDETANTVTLNNIEFNLDKMRNSNLHYDKDEIKAKIVQDVLDVHPQNFKQMIRYVDKVYDTTDGMKYLSETTNRQTVDKIIEKIETKLDKQVGFRKSLSLDDKNLIDSKITFNRTMIDGIIQNSTYITSDKTIQVAPPHKQLNELSELQEILKTSKYFSDIEIDREADLKKIVNTIKQVENFNLNLSEKITFKVRKLGNYKADGLYMDSIKTVACDLTSPSALIHELTHSIDFNTNLNMDLEKQKIIEKYKSKIDTSQLPEKKVEYFLEDTEILARLGELAFSLETIDSGLYNNNDSMKIVSDIDYYIRSENIYFNFTSWDDSEKKEVQQFFQSFFRVDKNLELKELKEGTINYDLNDKNTKRELTTSSRKIDFYKYYNNFNKDNIAEIILENKKDNIIEPFDFYENILTNIPKLGVHKKRMYASEWADMVADKVGIISSVIDEAKKIMSDSDFNVFITQHLQVDYIKRNLITTDNLKHYSFIKEVDNLLKDNIVVNNFIDFHNSKFTDKTHISLQLLNDNIKYAHKHQDISKLVKLDSIIYRASTLKEAILENNPANIDININISNVKTDLLVQLQHLDDEKMSVFINDVLLKKVKKSDYVYSILDSYEMSLTEYKEEIMPLIEKQEEIIDVDVIDSTQTEDKTTADDENISTNSEDTVTDATTNETTEESDNVAKVRYEKLIETIENRLKSDWKGSDKELREYAIKVIDEAIVEAKEKDFDGLMDSANFLVVENSHRDGYFTKGLKDIFNIALGVSVVTTIALQKVENEFVSRSAREIIDSRMPKKELEEILIKDEEIILGSKEADVKVEIIDSSNGFDYNIFPYGATLDEDDLFDDTLLIDGGVFEGTALETIENVQTNVIEQYITSETNVSEIKCEDEGEYNYSSLNHMKDIVSEIQDEKIDTNELIDDLLGSNKPKSKNKHKQ